jgi:Fe2+ transport system protein FeoA
MPALPPEPTTPTHDAQGIPLTQLKRGGVGTVRGCGPDGEAAVLRAMGLRNDARVRLCRLGEPCIVQVLGQCGCSCRIGLARPLAERVLVEAEG